MGGGRRIGMGGWVEEGGVGRGGDGGCRRVEDFDD